MVKRIFWLLMIGVLGACTLADVPPTETKIVFEGVPQVVIASPLSQEQYAQGASVNILARIDNAGTDIARVEILLNDSLIGVAQLPNEAGSASFTVTSSWLAQEIGDQLIRVVAYRADNSAGESSVSMSVVSTASPTPAPSATPNITATPTQEVVVPTLAPTQEAVLPTATVQQAQQAVASATPETPAVQPTSSAPQIKVLQGANVRSGPGLVFNPPLGQLPAEAIAPILAISTDRQWYKIQFGSANGWISSAVVETTGNLASLPVEAGPPPPVPTATPTPAPATATPAPASQADLSIVLIQTAPNPPVCLQSFVVTVRVVNTGTANSVESVVTVQDFYNNAGGAIASTLVRPLAPNESADVTVTLTVSNNFAEAHVIRADVDSDNRTPESNETNNTNTFNYTLATGGC